MHMSRSLIGCPVIFLTAQSSLLLLLQLYDDIGDITLIVKEISPSLTEIAKLLLANQQLGSFTKTPDDKILGYIVLHAVAVFNCNCSHDAEEHFLFPFVNMLTNPEAISVSCYHC